MEWLKNFFSSFWNYLKEFFIWVVQHVLFAVGWLIYQIFNGFLTVVHAFFSALDFSAILFTNVANWSDLPPQLIWLINQLALPQCLTLLVNALLIRLIINLIPAEFTRV